MGRGPNENEETEMSGIDMSIGDVLGECLDLDPRLCLYLPFDKSWELGTIGMLLLECDDEFSANALDRGLRYIVEIPAIQSIVRNARLQIDEADANELLKAFLFYCDNDAFIDFGSC